MAHSEQETKEIVQGMRAVAEQHRTEWTARNQRTFWDGAVRLWRGRGEEATAAAMEEAGREYTQDK